MLLIMGIMCYSNHTYAFQDQTNDKVTVTGTIMGPDGMPLPTVTVIEKGTNNGTQSDFDGNYSIDVAANATLVFSYVGFKTLEVPVNGQTDIDPSMEEDVAGLDEIVITGYTAQDKKSITGAISTVTSEDLEKVHGGSTVSSGLAGKLPGVSFRMPDGRPGASASIQIRNMGTPLYVIDGIQQDEGQFNNLSPNDIASITILKDASAAIYGVRAANGVVVVTTKRGKKGTRNTVNVNAYTGWQNWTRFPETVNDSYQYVLAQAEAEINSFGSTNITQDELEKYRTGTDRGYQSFNWRDFIVKKNAPLTNINVSASGGSENINYYLSYTSLDQESVLGDEFKFNRSNIQSNVDANISKRLKVGVQINGRIEKRENPGIPGADDYWLPRFAILRNRPYERPYANDNPEYLNDIGHNETNWALHNYKIGGYQRDTWRVLQTNFTAEYDIPWVDGLSAKGMYSYYIADRVLNGHEYTYEAYTYDPNDDTYTVTGGSTNPWRERRTRKNIRNIYQGQLQYKQKFDEHSIDAVFIAERQEALYLEQWVHSVPGTNELPLIYFSDMDTYDDYQDEDARIGYIARLSYNYADKYYLEVSGRRDASWKFAPSKRVGYFPSASAGWRITEEKFFKDLIGENSVLDNLKIRGSYGVLGDDNINLGINPGDPRYIGPYDYLTGYEYNVGTAIFNNEAVIAARDKGQPVNNISWFESKITDIGADFYLFDSKLSGTVDYFYRKRTGLRGQKFDVLTPDELGYKPPEENTESDAVYGFEGSLSYADNIGDFNYSVTANGSIARSKFLSSYKPRFKNSYDQWDNSNNSDGASRAQDRYNTIFWGYTAVGQFQSQEEIDNYPVDIDGRGNSTLLPGDIIYKDENGDKRIDGYDITPIGYNSYNPLINFGMSINLSYKGFDFTADFSGASGFSWNQNWEQRWAFQNTGALNKIFLDRWHRADPFDVNSEWIPGKYPALRYNEGGHSNYNKNSTFWLHNVTYLKARTIELGYNLPKSLLDKISVQKCRLYINGYNLFSIDNLSEYGVDPEVVDENGLQYPQNRFVNVGVNISL
tara:strand:- start:5386 stop:8550 length:3165 start_codon:yes stop_codon:yes gene_type:complete